jgi:hypothetical protein
VWDDVHTADAVNTVNLANFGGPVDAINLPINALNGEHYEDENIDSSSSDDDNV